MKKLFIFALVLCVSIIMVQPLMAEDGVGKANGENGASVRDIAVRFYWGHCGQTYSATNSSWTWCLDRNNNVWWGTSDNDCGNMMIESAGSGHWFGVNVYNTRGNWNYCRLLNY